MIPASMTGDGLDHSMFNPYSRGLQRAQVATFALGKPGVDFFKSWELKDLFYDLNLYQNLGWQDLINNLSDTVMFVKNPPCVDHERLNLLGHSEGTQVAADWPEFMWDWKPGQDQVSFEEIEKTLRDDEHLNAMFMKAKSAKIWSGVFNRPPLYGDASRLTQNIFVFTGELDVQTRPEEALKLKAACVAQKKLNCELTIVPGLGHAMSLPKGTRQQKLLDATLGPVENSFIDLLAELGQRL